MQAIILAAGMGKRLGELTKNNTKCMVEVGGVKLIERALRILDKKSLSRIILVVGYQYENLTTFVNSLQLATPIEYIVNDVYNRTNNIFSLSLAKEQMMQEDTLLLESDLIFEERLIDLLIEDKRDTLALVDKIYIFSINTGCHQYLIACCCYLCRIVDKTKRTFFCSIAIFTGIAIYINIHFPLLSKSTAHRALDDHMHITLALLLPVLYNRTYSSKISKREQI